MKYYAIVVAGGTGNRMKTAVAKQFLILNDRPVLMHTLEAFAACVLNPEIILVLNIQQQAYWKELCTTYKFDLPHQLVSGGEHRFDSVKNGLKQVKGEAVVAIHDAVRPLVSPALIMKAYETALASGNAIAAIAPVDSVRRKRGESPSEALDRSELLLIQTPQTFKADQLRTAYLQSFTTEFTDDASVVERAGFEINILQGERNNIKITYPEDLEMAAFLMQKKGS